MEALKLRPQGLGHYGSAEVWLLRLSLRQWHIETPDGILLSAFVGLAGAFEAVVKCTLSSSVIDRLQGDMPA